MEALKTLALSLISILVILAITIYLLYLDSKLYTYDDKNFITELSESDNTDDILYSAVLNSDTNQKIRLIDSVNKKEKNNYLAQYLLATACNKNLTHEICLNNSITQRLFEQNNKNSNFVALRASYLVHSKRANEGVTLLSKIDDTYSFTGFEREIFELAEETIEKHKNPLLKFLGLVIDSKYLKSMTVISRESNKNIISYCSPRGNNDFSDELKWHEACFKLSKSMLNSPNTNSYLFGLAFHKYHLNLLQNLPTDIITDADLKVESDYLNNSNGFMSKQPIYIFAWSQKKYFDNFKKYGSRKAEEMTK